MKEATQLLISFATKYQRDFEPEAHRYLNDDCLFKALNNGKKVIVDFAHECIYQIILVVVNPK